METKHKVQSLDSIAGYNEDNKRWSFEQDEKPFIEAAKLEREQVAKRDVGYKKACTIPTIVQLEIFEKYAIDIMDENFMNDSDKVKRVLQIIRSEYPYLMSY
jgi:hypothetical protein